ncbi:Replication factor C subunit 5 [Wickerhamiella sorbophila]|uniref:Replication factor C subunit 5 n=1 Tax=Wickerhamiella sorbophila TaxID=45607 RepID=A0A2T0FN30_9ASCO|nr:Replication factor C subunit 5 [Wickerhamiella sorbophila]PRT56384.1 Replication factor C subunit 5 [Wickerhamiella sorbophila]
MLWVHKYRPTSLESLDYNEPLTETLRRLADKEDFPHLLVYGPPGAGKKTRVSCLLRELFGPSALKIKEEQRVLQAGTRKFDFVLVSSNHHIEINPAEAGNQDRVVVQELLKEIAQTQPVDVTAKHRFKVVVINEADSLTRDAQAALRRTMEIYSPNLRLILLANTTGSIMGPIKSRTLLVRVPAPTTEDIGNVLAKVADAQDVQLPQDDAARNQLWQNISEKSNRNLRRALLMLETMYARSEKIDASTQVPLTDWQLMIDRIAQSIVKSRTVQQLASVRKDYYELLTHCIPETVILKELLFALLPRVSAVAGKNIVDAAALYDHRLRLGNKGIYHLEAFTASTMRILEEA